MNNTELSQEELFMLKGIDSEIAFTLDSYNRDIIIEGCKIALNAAKAELEKNIDETVDFNLVDIRLEEVNEIDKTIKNEGIFISVKNPKNGKVETAIVLDCNDKENLYKIFGINAEELSDVRLLNASRDIVSSIVSSTYMLFGVNRSEVELEVSYFDKSIDEGINEINASNVVAVTYDIKLNGESIGTKVNMICSVDVATVITDIMSGTEKYEEYEEVFEDKPMVSKNYDMDKAVFPSLEKVNGKKHDNIGLIMDVPLEISVVLGRARRTIRDILEFNNGSLIELNRMAEEPVEILVNGKKIALGEVVVIDENFGVRITDIISNMDRIKSLK